MTQHPRLAVAMLFVGTATFAACGGGGKSKPVEKLVFVSSMTFTGNLGGVGAADDACQVLADAAGLGGSFLAWLSDSTTSPVLDFTHNDAPYVLVDGTRIADDWTDLTDGTLQNPIDLDEYGQPAPLSDKLCTGAQTWVMTGTYEAGTYAGLGFDCSGWTSDLGAGTWGRSDKTTNWSFACSGGGNQDFCGAAAPIFCVEQ